MTLAARRLLSPQAKAMGLIGASTASPVWFSTRFGIHTFGVRFPIDILILDRRNRIVRLKEKLLPNRIFLWPPIYNQVVELPAGFIAKHHLTLGTLLEISQPESSPA